MELISTSKAAEILGLSASSVRRLFDDGRLGGATTPKGHRRISKVDAESLAEELRNPRQFDDGIRFE